MHGQIKLKQFQMEKKSIVFLSSPYKQQDKIKKKKFDVVCIFCHLRFSALDENKKFVENYKLYHTALW
jgi:hypothetical protein